MTEETSEKVLAIIANIKKTRDKPIDSDKDEKNKDIQKKTDVENKHGTVRGKPKSGRFWKSQKEK